MKARAVHFLAGQVRRLAREDCGVALMMTLAVFLALYILCCGVFATGEIIRQRMELQNACDAAAYSAAVVQADALSRMAVVNRAMAWTYIQMSREQMDYIVYSWLDLTCRRFRWDRENKAVTGSIVDGRHYNFGGWVAKIISAAVQVVTLGFYRGGFNCQCSCHGEEGCGWYIGVEDTDGNRILNHVSLNGRNDEAETFIPVFGEEGLERMIEDKRAQNWAEKMLEQIEGHKETIFDLNVMLQQINNYMRRSISETVQWVLYQNLPKDASGEPKEDLMGEYYWSLSGGMSASPEAYCENGFLEKSEDEPDGSYFRALANTEADEIQFLTMADGVPGRQEGAPEWMTGRPVALTDYFGLSKGEKANPTEEKDGFKRFVAGGLDQWYVRGTDEEAMDDGLVVEKGMRDPPGGIQRVYKHSNREEGGQWRVRMHYRPNHIFRGDITAIGRMDFGEYVEFLKVRKRLDDILPGEYTVEILEAIADVFTYGSASGLVEVLRVIVEEAVGGIVDGIMDEVKSRLLAVFQDMLDIPPSNEHTLTRYPDQCHNVNETTGLVSQYEWESAYWMCPWSQKRSWSWLSGWGSWSSPRCKKHYRIPVAEFLGCKEHGYGQWLTWLPKELEVLLRGGSPRGEYRSCFINFDGTKDDNRNTHLRGYARIYGDDREIFDERAYVGEVACPWVLSESFFAGDGTILVGLARRQRNPLLKLVAKGVSVAHPSIYEPFSPQPGSDKYLVGLSAARAVWAPRPDHPETGMESVNGRGMMRSPGQYEPRYDSVADHLPIAENEYKAAGMGCVCGKPETQERLLRMWNLSQTDWDAALLPLRHAFGGHTAYDSHENLAAASEWDYDNPDQNSVDKLVSLLSLMKWGCMNDGTQRLGSGEILALPVPAGSASPYRDLKSGRGWEWDWDESGADSEGGNAGVVGTLKDMFVFRRLL